MSWLTPGWADWLFPIQMKVKTQQPPAVRSHLASSGDSLDRTNDVDPGTIAPENTDAPGTVQPSVLASLYDEIAQSLDRQLGQIDSLNERAQQVFGFAAVILTIIAAVAPQDAKAATKIAFLAAIPLFGLAAWFAATAWRFASWRGDPDVHALWDHRRKDPEEHFRYQVIVNRLDSITHNEKSIATKVERVKRAHLWLYWGFAYVAALVAFRLLQ